MQVSQLLSQITSGDVGITKLDENTPEIVERLAELGLFEGSILTIIRNSSLRAPIVVSYKGSQMIMSRKIADRISVVLYPVT